MTIKFNTRREQFYALIVILGYLVTNIYFYIDDPYSIIEFLRIQFLYILMGGVYEGAILWMATKFKQERMSVLDGYGLIMVIVLSQALLSFFFGDLSSTITALLGAWTMTVTLFLGIVIVRQIYIVMQPSDHSDSHNM